MTNRSRTVFVVTTAAAAGLASGFAFRWVQRGTPVAAAPAAASGIAPQAEKEAAAKAAQAAAARRQSPLTASLQEDLALSTGVTRWLHWVTAMEKAKLSDFPHLARLAKDNSVALKMITARWIELDPQHVFRTLLDVAAGGHVSENFPSHEIADALFNGWAAQDPAGAIAALSTGDSRFTRNWRWTVVNKVMEKDPEMGLKAMADWRVENYSPTTKGIEKWAANDPKHAAEFALAHPSGFATTTALNAIGKVWAKSDPAGALEFAAGRRNAFSDELAEGIVREWAGSDVGKTAEWLAQADPATRNRLSAHMVEVWAKTDTGGAMAWAQDNLSGSRLDEAVGSVIRGAAQRNKEEAAGLVADMEPSPARTKAAMALAKEWMPSRYPEQAPSPEAIAWVGSLDPSSMKEVIDQTQWSWSSADAAGFAEFLAGPAGKHASEYAVSSAARELTRKDPQKALEWAGRLPGGPQSAAITNVYSEWQQSQPAAAAAWLRGLPAGDLRREQFTGAMLNAFLPKEWQSEALTKTVASGGEAARSAVEKLSISQENKNRLLQRLQLQ